MPHPAPRILQLKATLSRIRPPIWRRLLISADATFWELHVALQCAMGWNDTHLHEFAAVSPREGRRISITVVDEHVAIGPPGREMLTRLDWEVPQSDYLARAGDKVGYVYDFGDNWDHTILVEKVLLPEPGRTYPCCIAGRRACPPEDCGGLPGYESLLEVLLDPSDPEHDASLEWVGEEYDPEHFDPTEVVFEDPVERLQELREGLDAEG